MAFQLTWVITMRYFRLILEGLLLLMFMKTASFWLLPEALKKKELDKHRFFHIEISQSYLLRVIPIRFSWVTHTLLQTSFVRGFEAPATDDK
jgi:hypothetical protein